MGFLHKFVRNDAMKTDPPEIYNLNILLITIAVSGRRRLTSLIRPSP